MKDILQCISFMIAILGVFIGFVYTSLRMGFVSGVAFTMTTWED